MSRSTLLLFVFAPSIIACATSAPDANGGDSGVAQHDASSGVHDSGSQPKEDAGGTNADATTQPQDDGGTLDAQTADVLDASAPKPIVFGHSPDTLYTFDVTTNNVALVGAFSGCTQSTLTQVIDLAIDSQMNAYATTFDGIYSVDLTNAQCTLVKAGSYPNSLSFVPAGTL